MAPRGLSARDVAEVSHAAVLIEFTLPGVNEAEMAWHAVGARALVASDDGERVATGEWP